MGEYYTLFSQYLNVLGIIWGGIKIGLLGFIIALIVLIVLKRFILVRRRYNALKYLARSYYFFIPVICLCFGFCYGMITTARDQVIEKLPLYQASAQSFVEQNFDFNLEVQTYTDKSLDKTIDDTVTDVQYIIMSELKLAKQNQQTTQQFILTVLESSAGMSYIKSNLKDKISSTTGIERQLVDEVFEIKLSNLLTGETIIKILAFYIKQVVSSFLIPIMIIWLILLLIPLIEIVFACRYKKGS